MNETFRLAYYKPSGNAPLGGVIVTALVGTALGALAGALYGMVSYAVPFVYVNLLLAVFLGIGLGAVAAKCLTAFHIRNVKFAAAAGFVVFISAYVTHWFFYLAVYGISKLSEIPGVFEIARHFFENPGDAWDGVKSVNDIGWSVSGSPGRGGTTVNGWLLWAVWAAEAALIGYLSLSASVRQARAPYSERRGMWMDAVELPKHAAFIENAAAFRESLSRGDYGALMTPLDTRSAPSEPSGEKYAEVTIYPDSWDPYLSVSNITVKARKKKSDMSVENVVKYLKVPAEIALKIKDALS
jgi:hypothetical protein